MSPVPEKKETIVIDLFVKMMSACICNINNNTRIISIIIIIQYNMGHMYTVVTGVLLRWYMVNNISSAHVRFCTSIGTAAKFSANILLFYFHFSFRKINYGIDTGFTI